MKRSILLALIILAVFGKLFAQDSYYYYQGKKIVLHEVPTKASVLSLAKQALKQQIAIPINAIHTKSINDTEFVIDLYQKGTKGTQNLVSILRDNINSEEAIVLPYYKSSNNKDARLTHRLYIELKDDKDYPILKELATKYHLINLRKISFSPLWYNISITPATKMTSLELANIIYETGLVKNAVPDITAPSFESIHDESFHLQWGLFNNQTPGLDIKVCAAWPYSTGRGIKIAILDNGMGQNHLDLASNIYMGFDTETQTSPHQDYSFNEENPQYPAKYHGSHCAGIAVAIQNNGIGISGVAPDAQLMPVSTNEFAESYMSFEERMAIGMNWAWKNGADVLSCSWTAFQSPILNAAIDSVLTRGRNGKGCILVFCAGNTGNNDLLKDKGVPYPGNYNPNILVVGALGKDGKRYTSSTYGQAVDVIAPGEDIYSCFSNGTANFGYKSGTSMATPHVAGLAALILERNPNLTGLQVRNIIEQNTTKVDASNYSYSTISTRPNGTWNQYCGYGLINAYEAVKNTPRW